MENFVCPDEITTKLNENWKKENWPKLKIDSKKYISQGANFFVKSRFAGNFHSKLQENETTLKLKFQANYWAHQPKTNLSNTGSS